ncbi:hypothetical protein, partial [Peptoniphilus harei]|uniref:hypothetical protein n=1 Tax=Peptoniphilus harei TaxID=54005 RepID=UPI001C49B9CB
EYNPTGYKDGTIETCETSYINYYDRVIDSFRNSDHVETEIDPDNYNFILLKSKKKMKIS